MARLFKNHLTLKYSMNHVVIHSQCLFGALLFNCNFINTYLLVSAVFLPIWRKVSTMFQFLGSWPYKHQNSNFGIIYLAILRRFQNGCELNNSRVIYFFKPELSIYFFWPWSSIFSATLMQGLQPRPHILAVIIQYSALHMSDALGSQLLVSMLH